MAYEPDGLIEGNVRITIEDCSFNKGFALYFFQNTFRSESRLSRVKTNYLYPIDFFPGSIAVTGFTINGSPYGIDTDVSDPYISLPVPAENEKTVISFHLRSKYPSRIGPFGFINNVLSSIYPPYPLIVDKASISDSHFIYLSKHDLQISIPDSMTLLGDFRFLKTSGSRKFFRSNPKYCPFISFSILPDHLNTRMLNIDNIKFFIHFLNPDCTSLSNLFFFISDCYSFFISNSNFKPAGKVILSPATIENDLLIKGIDLIYYDPKLISVKPKFRSLVDFNIIRSLMLEFIDKSAYENLWDQLFLSMINEFLSEQYYLYCHKELPQIPKSLFALSVVTSVDLNELYDKLNTKYGLSLNRLTLSQSYRYFLGNLDHNINFFSILKKIIGPDNVNRLIAGLLKKDPYKENLKDIFRSQLEEQGYLKEIEEIIRSGPGNLQPEKDEKRGDLGSLRGRGSLSRYSVGFENNPRIITLFDNPEQNPYYFYANSQILIEPLDLNIGYVYKFFITRDDVLKTTYGIEVEKNSDLLDGKLLCKVLFGKELTDKKSQHELQLFTSYVVHKNIKTMEDETDKIYYLGLMYNTTNRVDEFTNGYELSVTYRASVSRLFGMYDFADITADYDYNHYWTNYFFTRYNIKTGILTGDKPSFIYYNHKSYNKAVSEKNSKIKMNQYLGFGIEAGTVLKRNIDKDFFDTLTLLRLEGSLFLETSLLGDNFSHIGDDYATDIGFRINALTEFQNLLPVLISFDIAFPLDSLELSDIYFRIKIKEVF